ncbi:MAG: FixH family protein [Candidatus Zixiibacteriota bacterium]
MMTTTTKSTSRWGIGVAVLYGGFVLFTLAIVAFASLQHFDLVEDHYYERSLDYQQQIDRINRTSALSERPKIGFDAGSKDLLVSFPATLTLAPVAGTITLYRPSGAVMDVSVPIALDNGLQRISAAKLPAGFWKAKIRWDSGGHEYYQESSFFVE